MRPTCNVCVIFLTGFMAQRWFVGRLLSLSGEEEKEGTDPGSVWAAEVDNLERHTTACFTSRVTKPHKKGSRFHI